MNSIYDTDNMFAPFTCSSCGKRVRGITMVNGMDFCAKCYQETFVQNQTNQFVDLMSKEILELKITNLESKLEDKDKELIKVKKELDDALYWKHEHFIGEKEWKWHAQSLEHKLEKATLLKFSIGKKVWYIDNRINDYNEQRYVLDNYVIDEIAITKDGIKYLDEDGYFIDAEDLFDNENDALDKIKEFYAEEK